MIEQDIFEEMWSQMRRFRPLIKIRLQDGRMVEISFRKNRRTEKSNYGRILLDTLCLVEIHTESGAIMQSALTQAKLHPKDTYNNIIGKKLALKRALQRIFPFKVDKSHRGMIWMAFWTMVDSWRSTPLSQEREDLGGPPSQQD